MRLKISISVILAFVILTFLQRTYTLREVEFDREMPFEKTFTGFEMSLSKKFTADAHVDGQSIILENIQNFEKQSADESRMSEFAESVASRPVNSVARNLNFTSSFQSKEVKGLKISENLFYADGLKYRFDSNLILGLQLENPLAWFRKAQDKKSSLGSARLKDESSLLFTFSYVF